jgi:hypothetical protein
MARILKFEAGDSDKFSLFMQGYQQTNKEDRNPKLASKINKKLDEISHSRYDLDSVVSGKRIGDLEYTQRAALLALRDLNEEGGEIILEDAEFDYLKECIKKANWTNWIATEGYAIEEWIDSIKAVNLKELKKGEVVGKIEPTEEASNG